MNARTASGIRVAWHGEFAGEASLARVNRHLAAALIARGEIDVIPCGEPSPQIEERLGAVPRRREDLLNDGVANVTLSHQWPPRFLNPGGGHDIHIQPWEYGLPPAAWVEQLRERADDVWCYTEYVRRGYIEGGLPEERVHVVPLGFDPLVYHPGVEPFPISPPDTCAFVFVGGTLPRKNVGAVIKAFVSAFKLGEAAVLLIKDNPSIGVYDGVGTDKVRAITQRTDIPPIRYIDAQYTDADMARFYRMAAALVHPYRGEGFALPVLEAMACGTPVIVTAGGACDDFVDDEVGYRVPAERQSLGTELQGLPLSGEGWWLEIDEAALATAMRAVFEDRAEARRRGANAARRAHAVWTWSHAALSAAERLRALVATPPMPPGAQNELLASYQRADASSTGIDGMLEAVFARIRGVDPIFVDLGARRGTGRNATVFGMRYGWRGVMIDSDVAACAEVRATFAGNPRVSVVQAPLDPNAFTGIPSPIDLLSLADNDAAISSALKCWRPRVVVAPASDAVHALLAAAGYSDLGAEATGTRAVFLQNALVPLAGFAVEAR